jgi:hypothetical protein
MTQAIRYFMFFGSAAFIAASLIHFGVLIDGYEHEKAGTAESVIGIVLLVTVSRYFRHFPLNERRVVGLTITHRI